MTLEEAIKHAEEVAEEQEKAAKEWHENQVRKCELIRFAEMDYTHENECKECAEEHRQLAEWLKDYQRLLKAIDDIQAEIRHFMLEINPSSSESDYACNYILDVINKYKEGGADCESTSEIKETET